LIERLVCEILRKLEEVGNEQGMTTFCLKLKERLGLIFAAPAG
jgi:hypothetical protein